MSTIEKTVKYIRSKNAGPFWLTIDAFCNNVEDTKSVTAAFEREREFIAKSFQVKPEELEIFCLEHIQVAKISLPGYQLREAATRGICMADSNMFHYLISLAKETWLTN